MDEIIVHATDRTDTRITRTIFKGVERVDIRVYMDIDGERRPTKKGVSLPLDKLPALIDALRVMQSQGALAGDSESSSRREG